MGRKGEKKRARKGERSYYTLAHSPVPQRRAEWCREQGTPFASPTWVTWIQVLETSAAVFLDAAARTCTGNRAAGFIFSHPSWNASEAGTQSKLPVLVSDACVFQPSLLSLCVHWQCWDLNWGTLTLYIQGILNRTKNIESTWWDPFGRVAR